MNNTQMINIKKHKANFLLDEFLRSLKDLLIFELKKKKIPIRKYRGFNSDLFQFKQILDINIKKNLLDFSNILIENKDNLLSCELLRIKLYDDEIFSKTEINEIISCIKLIYQIIKKLNKIRNKK